MEHGEHDELRDLLREWSVPGAPPSLDRRILNGRRPERHSWWRFLLAGSIRIPLPAVLGLAAVLVWMAVILVRRPAAPPEAPAAVSLVDFRPVNDLNVRVIRNRDRH